MRPHTSAVETWGCSASALQQGGREHPFTHSFVRTFTHSFTHYSLTRSFTHSFLQQGEQERGSTSCASNDSYNEILLSVLKQDYPMGKISRKTCWGHRRRQGDGSMGVVLPFSLRLLWRTALRHGSGGSQPSDAPGRGWGQHDSEQRAAHTSQPPPKDAVHCCASAAIQPRRRCNSVPVTRANHHRTHPTPTHPPAPPTCKR